MREDRKAEAEDWARLATSLGSFMEYAMDHLDPATGEVVEGSVYERVYPLLIELSMAAHELAGWCLSASLRGGLEGAS